MAQINQLAVKGFDMSRAEKYGFHIETNLNGINYTIDWFSV